MAPQAPCRICEGGYKDPIEDRLAAGRTLTAIVAEAAENGITVSTDMIRAHIAHTPGLIAAETIDARNVSADAGGMNRDLAIVVRDAVYDKMKDPDSKMELKVEHGLKAQMILEARVERDKDRMFQLNLARLLSGGGAIAPTALIEPKNVTPDDDEDSPLLAPPELRASATT